MIGQGGNEMARHAFWRVVNRAGPAPGGWRARAYATTRRDQRAEWYSFRNNAAEPGVAEILIYDEIGWFGVPASDFVRELSALNVSRIDLRLNTPGGDAFDGIAIYNALRAHPATVNVFVDALAASAGSVIAMAGDHVMMRRSSRMMIHDASGLAIGNAEDMRELAGLLDGLSDDIAETYAYRAGGDVDVWRERMRAETWYSASEAVEAGLADAYEDGAPPADARLTRPHPVARPPRLRTPAAAPPAPPVAPEPPAPPVETPADDWIIHPDTVFPWDEDLALALRATLREQADDMPAPPAIESPAKVPPDPTDDAWMINPDDFYNALREGLSQ